MVAMLSCWKRHTNLLKCKQHKLTSLPRTAGCWISSHTEARQFELAAEPPPHQWLMREFPMAVCSAPSCSHSSPMTSLRDAMRAQHWSPPTIITNNEISYGEEINSLLLSVGKPKELIVDFRKKEAKTHTHLRLHESSWGGTGEQFYVPGNHREPILIYTQVSYYSRN